MKKVVNKTVIYLTLIIVLAGALRIVRGYQEKRYSVDAYLYFQMADNWAMHGADYMCLYNGDNMPPLLLWVMANSYKIGMTPEYIAITIGVLLGSLMPLAAFWIAVNLFAREDRPEDNHIFYGLLAAFLVAIHPFFIRISVSCLREIFYLPVFAFAIGFAVSAVRNRSLWRWCAFAALVAVANLARREGVTMIGIFFVWQLVEFVADRKAFIKNISYYGMASFCVLIVFLIFTLSPVYMLSDCYNWSPFIIKIK